MNINMVRNLSQTNMNTMNGNICIDNLSNMFSKSANITVENNTPYELYLNETGLCSGQILEQGLIIGEIYGDMAYIWELDHIDFIILDNDFVLDVKKYKKHILTYIREDNETSNLNNCCIQMMTDEKNISRFYIITEKIIMPHEELVYSAFEFIN